MPAFPLCSMGGACVQCEGGQGCPAGQKCHGGMCG
jgi:hypothetical protein